MGLREIVLAGVDS